MGAWMNDAIHVKVEIIVFEIIRIWLRDVYGQSRAIVEHLALILDDRTDDLGILPREPSEKRWDTHVEVSVLDAVMKLRLWRRLGGFEGLGSRVGGQNLSLAQLSKIRLAHHSTESSS